MKLLIETLKETLLLLEHSEDSLYAGRTVVEIKQMIAENIQSLGRAIFIL